MKVVQDDDDDEFYEVDILSLNGTTRMSSVISQESSDTQEVCQEKNNLGKSHETHILEDSKHVATPATKEVDQHGGKSYELAFHCLEESKKDVEIPLMEEGCQNGNESLESCNLSETQEMSGLISDDTITSISSFSTDDTDDSQNNW